MGSLPKQKKGELPRRQPVFEHRPGGWSVWSRNRKWTDLVNRPLAAKSSPEEAQTFKPVGGSVPMGYGHTLWVLGAGSGH